MQVMLANSKSLLFLIFKLPFCLSHARNRSEDQSQIISEDFPKSDHLNRIELIKKQYYGCL